MHDHLDSITMPDTHIDLTVERSLSLAPIFTPRNVAIIGASNKAGSVGYTVLRNLMSSTYAGKLYPVNPSHTQIFGTTVYPSIASIDEQVDLAVVITPAVTVPKVIEECIEAGVRSAVIISAGFREVGASGMLLEDEIVRQIQGSDLRVIGPNCFGVMNPRIGFNATFSASIPPPGNVGFITQSGALGSAIVDKSIKEMIGFSLFASVGSMIDVSWSDLLTYFADDEHTESIILYMESIGNASAFMEAARTVTAKKPVIVIKPGKTQAGARAASSHTGALIGSDQVFDAAFRQCGVIRVNEMSELFSVAELFAKQPHPKGPRLTILTNAGGPGVLATDELLLGGGTATMLSEPIYQQLSQTLPAAWSKGNPVDILGDADPARYADALQILRNDPDTDGLLVILAPQAMTSPTQIARELIPYARSTGKPILTSWIGGEAVQEGINLLNNAGIPTFEYPETAAKMFNYMWRYTAYVEALKANEPFEEHIDPSAIAQVENILTNVSGEGRTLLTEYETKRVLASYAIPVVRTELAHDEDAAIALAEQIGYPIVLKLHSHRITHKAEAGGVTLNLCNASEVRSAFRSIREATISHGSEADFAGVTVQPMIHNDGYELIVGAQTDPQFGPVLLFGKGGALVELYKDQALALPPLSPQTINDLLERTIIYRALKGIRGKNALDIEALKKLLIRFSQLVVEHPKIEEIEINPLVMSEQLGVLALDARAVIRN
jgi:acetyltransferase